MQTIKNLQAYINIKDNIIVSDPYTGSIRYYDRSLFISRSNYLGKRAVWYEWKNI